MDGSPKRRRSSLESPNDDRGIAGVELQEVFLYDLPSLTITEKED